MPRIRILFLTLGSPHPPDRGAQIRDFHVIREVARRHHVGVLSLLYPGERVPEGAGMAEVCASASTVALPARSPAGELLHAARGVRRGRPLATLPFYDVAAAARLREIAERERVDTVQIEHSFLVPYLDALPPRLRRRALLSLHNVGAVQYRRMLAMPLAPRQRATALLKSRLMQGWEVEHAARFAHTLVVSEADARLLRGERPGLPLSVVPNGVDTGALQPLPDPGGCSLLFTGTLGYPPNADAVMYYAREVLPRVRRRVPQARLVVVGHAPPREVRALAAHGEIVLAESVPDVVPYYREAVASVVPLRAGSGTRLKILEAMALGRPVVSTTVGCEGLEVSDGEHLLVADGPQPLADASVRLLREPALRRRLRERARALVRSRYDWSAIGEMVSEIHERVAARP